jgi:hypothetical protein
MKQFVITMLLLCSFSLAWAQGMYWKSTSEGPTGKHTEENFAAPKMFKMSQTGSENGAMIMIARLDKQLIWIVEPDKKTYSEMTFADMKKFSEKMVKKMAPLKEQLKSMPEEQRNAMKKMMGAGSDEPISVKKTSETKSILGHKCSKMTVFRGKEEFMTMWLAKDISGFAPLMADWKEFSRQMEAMASQFNESETDMFKEIDGFPMETSTTVADHKMTSTVVKVEMRAISASEFEVPSGYTKTKNQLEESMKNMDNEE